MNKEKIFLIVIFIGVLFMGIGYATVNNSTLTISGLLSGADNGTVRITEVTQTQKTNNITVTESHTDTSIAINLSFDLQRNDSTASDEHSVTYRITIYNDSWYTYNIGPEVFNPAITKSAPSGESLDHAYQVNGISRGDSIESKQSKTFTIKITAYPSGGRGTYQLGVNSEVKAEESTEGILTGTISGNTTGDLTGSNTMVPFTATLLNSYQRSKTFNFELSNPNYSIVDANGNAYPTQTINAETENQNYTFYIKRNSDKYPNSPQQVNVYLVPTDDDRSSIGVVTLSVDVDLNLTDNTDPVISSLTVTKGNTTRTLKAQWVATDNIAIDHYDVFLYNNSNQIVQSQTNLVDDNYTFTNVANGTYYVTLIAYDSRNSAEQNTTAKSYTWTYSVTISCDGCTASPSSGSVEAGGTFTATFDGDSNHNPPSGMDSVTMYDSTTGIRSNVSNGTYHYNDSSTSSYQFKLENITGNVAISASGTNKGCLVKGTKIMLASGKYKNVEDIKYDDLLAVWNYNTGTITYEYPIWIEKEKKTSYITRIEFSDNTYLDIAINHALYDTDLNMFVDMYGDNHFKIGSNIAKINNDGTFSKVKITNIKTINKETTYYFIGSTTYYNVIANNILTTDQNTMISNLYGFNNNAIWPEEKNIALANKSNIVNYNYFKDILPYYLFKGFRVEEAGYLFNNNSTSSELFKEYIIDYITSEKFLLNPINKNGHNYWMVTTNLDNINDNNKFKYLFKEGSLYTLPNNAKSWYSTSDNKYYNPGEFVTINHGMHFIAIK